MTELTPAQKAAATRAKNKAAKAAALAAEAAKPTLDAENTVTVATGEIAVTATPQAAAAVETQLPPVVEAVVDGIDAIGNDANFQVTASRVTAKFSARTRNILYTLGIVLGTVATAAFPVIAALTGQTQLIAGSAVAIALALSNLLAKANLSKTAADIADDNARGLPTA